MKNINVLPTNNPSRLHFTEFGEELVFTPKYEKLNGVNIYITSDEEIKEGDWVKLFVKHIDKEWVHKVTKEDLLLYTDFNNEGSKIILTTDQDLIKDGVQAIDDEFIEWFVNNPSCEEVEIKSLLSDNGNVFYGYKIIIPKEEPKQRLEKYSERFDNDKSTIGNPYTWGKRIVEEPKQETLEEAAEKYEKIRLAYDENYIISNDIQDLKESYYYKGRRDQCIKWQQDKNKYSEEDMMFAYEQGARLALISQSPLALHKGEFPTPKEWFEQFKNK